MKDDPAYKPTPRHNLQFSVKSLYRNCLTLSHSLTASYVVSVDVYFTKTDTWFKKRTVICNFTTCTYGYEALKTN